MAAEKASRSIDQDSLSQLTRALGPMVEDEDAGEVARGLTQLLDYADQLADLDYGEAFPAMKFDPEQTS